MIAHKWLVGITGGSGYIGTSVAKHFISSFDVKLLDVRPPTQKFLDCFKEVNFQNCDVRNFEEVRKSLEDVDFVVHAAIVQIPIVNERKRLGYEVNIMGTQNVCRTVDENPKIKGVILAGSWHTIGERGLKGIINEEFGFRPDKVEDRARLYALAKIAQESIFRFYDEMSEKIFAIIRMGTVLGDGMPEKTAANIFIKNGLAGKPLTPYEHSMSRPMLYVDIDDVCRAYENFARRILNGEVQKSGNSLAHIVNLYYPKPVTILELAELVRDVISKCTNGRIQPTIEVVNSGKPNPFNEDSKRVRIDISKALNLFGLKRLKSPRESIEEIVEARMRKVQGVYAVR
jgi:UDP-glucose 4-epimerase